MTEDQLLERIVRLEFQNDQLTTEAHYVDALLQIVGFAEGLTSTKKAVRELTDSEYLYEKLYEDGMPNTPPGVDD